MVLQVFYWQGVYFYLQRWSWALCASYQRWSLICAMNCPLKDHPSRLIPSTILWFATSPLLYQSAHFEWREWSILKCMRVTFIKVVIFLIWAQLFWGCLLVENLCCYLQGHRLTVMGVSGFHSYNCGQLLVPSICCLLPCVSAYWVGWCSILAAKWKDLSGD